MESAAQQPFANLLTRHQLSERLTACGLPIATATLAVMAVRGNGPPYTKWGRTPFYDWQSSIDWARRRLEASQRHLPAGDTAAQHATA
jgi:hypothetical protein